MSETEISKAAKTLSKLGASKGGIASAQRMTPEQLTARGQKGAGARWGVPQAEYEGNLDIAGLVISAAVLEDGTRLLTQEEFLYTIGRARKAKGGHGASVDNQIPFLTAKNLEPFISNELRESTAPMIFRNMRGMRAYGYRAEILPEVCNVYQKSG